MSIRVGKSARLCSQTGPMQVNTGNMRNEPAMEQFMLTFFELILEYYESHFDKTVLKLSLSDKV